MSKRKQVSSPLTFQVSDTDSSGSHGESKHIKKPRLEKNREEQASISSSSAAAQLAQAHAEIKQMKLKHAAHAAEQKRNEQRISQLISDKTELARRNQELERKVATLRRCF